MHIEAGTPRLPLVSNRLHRLPSPILEQVSTPKELCHQITLGPTGLNKGTWSLMVGLDGVFTRCELLRGQRRVSGISQTQGLPKSQNPLFEETLVPQTCGRGSLVHCSPIPISLPPSFRLSEHWVCRKPYPHPGMPTPCAPHSQPGPSLLSSGL